MTDKTARLERVSNDGPTAPLTLDRDEITIGRSIQNHVTIDGDDVSRIHAALTRYPAGWCVRDVGSANGTYLNGNRVVNEAALRDGDELRIGDTTFVFRSGDGFVPYDTTVTTEPPPRLTEREQDVLRELCRPFGNGDVFSDPATVKEIAAALYVTDAAVKQHLAQLYRKFDIGGRGSRRRSDLANAAIRRGAINLADIR